MTQSSGPKPPPRYPPGAPPTGYPQQPQPQAQWGQPQPGYPQQPYPQQPQQWAPPQPPPQQQWAQHSPQPPAPAPMPMAAPGQTLVWKLHSGAKMALNVVGGLLVLLIVTIPFAIFVFVRTAGARVAIAGDELTFRNLFSKKWKLSSLRRLGVLAVPVYARGIGGMLARKKVGGDRAIHICGIDDRGKKMNLLISMFERHQEIINHVAMVTGLPVEEVKSGAFGPKWPGA